MPPRFSASGTRRGREANSAGTQSARRAENNQRPHSAAAKVRSWSLHFVGRRTKRQQILCRDSSAKCAQAQGIDSRNETHRVESALLAAMERATGSETCSNGDGRSARGLRNKDTVDTNRIRTDLHLVEKIERDRSVEFHLLLFYNFVLGVLICSPRPPRHAH